METPQLYKDLSAMIEYKINQRNELSKKRPRPDGIIQIIDREIDILEKIECYIPALEQKHAETLIITKRQAFELGRQAGIMEQKTGRDHSSYFYK